MGNKSSIFVVPVWLYEYSGISLPDPLCPCGCMGNKSTSSVVPVWLYRE